MKDIFQYFNFNSLPKIQFGDIVEILLITFIIYQIVKNLKDTRAWIIVKGIIILFGFYLVAAVCRFEIIMLLFQGAISICAFAILLVFQPEIKRFLEDLGNKKISFNFLNFKKIKKTETYYSDKTIDELVMAMTEMAKVKTGALIVIEKDIPLTEFSDTGIKVDAEITSQLLINIFEKNTPLHDGAVIIKNNRVEAASCFLKLSENPKIDKKYGTRHRAGIGVSETTDALVLIVSEETGKISIVQNGGKFFYCATEKKLKEVLEKNQTSQEIILNKTKTFDVKNGTQKLQHNFWLKIICFLFVFALWLVTININDPITTRNFTVPIKVTNTEALIQSGHTYEPLSDKTVNVKVSARRKIIDDITINDIVAEADLQKISYTNAVPVDITINGVSDSNYTLSYKDNSIVLELVELVEKELPVEVVTTGSVPDGYFVKSKTSEIQNVSVTVTSSVAKTLEKAKLVIDVSDKTESFEETSAILIYDKNGNVVPCEKINISETVAQIEIRHSKQVPIVISISDEMKQKYNITNISSDISYVTLIGDLNNLEVLKELTVELNTELSTDTNTVIKTVTIEPPENLELSVPEQKVQVTINLDNSKTMAFELNKNNITIENKNPKYKYSIKNENLSFDIKGMEKILNNITADDIQFFINVENLSVGENNIPLQKKNDNVSFVSTPTIDIVVS